MSMPNRKPTALVVGAGIVGLSVALRLQLDGHDVTVVDADAPMTGCSFGNAGCLSEANIFPPITPDILAKLPRLLLSRDGPLIIRLSYLSELLPWFRRAWRGLQADAQTRTTAVMASITAQAIYSLEELVSASNAKDLLSTQGLLVAFRTSSALDQRAERLAVWQRFGIQVSRLTGAEVLDRVPALHRDMAGGLLFSGSGQCRDPYLLGMRYLERLKLGGARVERAKVIAIERQREGQVQVMTPNARLAADRIIVCAGYQSKALLENLGVLVPLVAERGYHLMLPKPGIHMNIPVIFGEPYFAATPMVGGIRLAGTAEFSRFESRPDYRRARMLFRQAQHYLPGIADVDARPWAGVRPTFPDGMPAIGALAGFPGVFYAFGHSHNGLTLSAITAKCISALISGRDIGIPIEAMALERFR